ncbi:MAG TPA: M48 family metallopeptidase [Blastocatellia bacterium]|nr:M48 family metallopeptidase [Blastocatellia bacterium]
MSMTQEKFEQLTERLQKLASKHPGEYKARVLLLAILGYFYIFAIIAVLLTIVGFLVWVTFSRGTGNLYLWWKLGAGLIVLIGIILRAMWVSFPAPEGMTLNREDALPLFEAVDALQKQLVGPKVHEILLIEEFNACISQVPRLGMFGWYRNYLAIGLPLMQALSPEQFRAVLAHEFGHLSGAHGRFTSWIYRIRITWFQLLTQLEEREHWGSFIFTKFIEWYAPYFSAYSFVLARAQEYEADRLAGDLAGNKIAADALVKLEVGAAFLQEEFWPSIFKQADTQPEPYSDPYTKMQSQMRTAFQSDMGKKWLEFSMLNETGSEDTHPALSDRLRALGREANLPEAATENAAEHFLGAALTNLNQDLDKRWGRVINTPWRERYKYVQDSQKHLEKLEQKAQQEALTVDEAWKRAMWTEEFKSVELALPLYQDVLSLKQNHAEANFALGRLFLTQNKEEGIELIEKSFRIKGEYMVPGCQIVCQYLMNQGKEEEAFKFLERATGKPVKVSRTGKSQAPEQSSDQRG